MALKTSALVSIVTMSVHNFIVLLIFVFHVKCYYIIFMFSGGTGSLVLCFNEILQQPWFPIPSFLKGLDLVHGDVFQLERDWLLCHMMY